MTVLGVAVALGALLGALFAVPAAGGGSPLSGSTAGASAPRSASSGAAGAEALAEARASLNASAASAAGGTGSRPAVSTTTPNWTQVNLLPVARTGASMAFDAALGYVVLFGGENGAGAVLNDTWEFSAGHWTKLEPPKSPPARWQASMAYDAKDHYLVLFGGVASGGVLLSDTWKFAAGHWTKLSPATSPPAMDFANLVYDANDSSLVLFGRGAAGAGPSVTWTFVGGAWTALHPAAQPAARFAAQMDYDPADGWVVLFGGYNSSNGNTYADTWNFSAGHWTVRSPTLAPPGRAYGVLAWDPIGARLILFGGANVSAGVSRETSDTWSLVHGVWSKLGPADHPSNRVFASAADGAGTLPLTVFGGTGPLTLGILNDTWTFERGAWDRVLDETPSPRGGGAMVYDASDGYVLLFGGVEVSSGGAKVTVLGDTWTFVGGVWSRLTTPIAPSPRADASAAYDEADGYVVLFGGANLTTLFHDTWTFHAGTWTELLSTGSHPSARSDAGIAYDPTDGYVVLFGGLTSLKASTTPPGTWAFAGGQWTNLSILGPSGREDPQMTWDAEDGYVLLYGGDSLIGGVTHLQNDTWLFVGGLWTNETAVAGTGPGELAGAGIADDTWDGYVVVYGGALSGTYSSASAEYTGGVWSALSPASSPGKLAYSPMAYDAVDGVLVEFGGFDTAGNTVGLTWEY